MTAPTIAQDITFALEPLPPLEMLEEIWRQFDQRAARPFFLTWTWMGTWLECLPPSTRTMLLRAKRGSETVGVAVLTLRQRVMGGILPIKQAWLNTVGEPAFDCITIEHNGFVSSVSPNCDLWLALADWFAAENIADELILPGVEACEPAREVKALLLSERREVGYRTPLRELTEDEGIAPLLSRNARQQLHRSIRAYERDGPLSLELARDQEAALDFFVQMKNLHIRSWLRRGRSHAFSNPFFETFHRALIPKGIAERSIDLLRVSAGHRTLGYLYNFRHDGIVFSYQSGFDDAAPGLRPGYVSHALAIAHYAASGMAYYDFLAETNRLKQSFGTERYALYWRRWRKPTVGFRTEALLRDAARTFGLQS